MQLVTKLLTILGGNSTPEPSDSVMQVPNLILPTISARRPVRQLTVPNTFTTPVDDSTSLYWAAFQTGPIAWGMVDLLFLNPGLWEIEYTCMIFVNDPTENQLTATWDPHGIHWGHNGGVSQLLACTFAWNQAIAGGPGPIPARGVSVMNFPQDARIQLSQPALSAGATSLLQAGVVAHRLS